MLESRINGKRSDGNSDSKKDGINGKRSGEKSDPRKVESFLQYKWKMKEEKK
jgi:hypothetical protein